MASDIPGFPAPIDGLDIAAGLRRVEGDAELYIALLHDFLLTERNAADVIVEALQSGDTDSATRRAHTVKGLAGTFGATHLLPAATDLETALRDARPQDEIDTHLQSFTAALSALIDELDAKLPAEADPEPATYDGPPDPLALASACRALAAQLEHYDIDARRTLENHSALFRAAFGDDYRPLEQALRHFDFDAASARLTEACRKHGIAVAAG